MESFQHLRREAVYWQRGGDVTPSCPVLSSVDEEEVEQDVIIESSQSLNVSSYRDLTRLIVFLLLSTTRDS